MGIISIGKGNIEFHSVDRALKIIKNAMLDEKEIWISGEKEYTEGLVKDNGYDHLSENELGIWLETEDADANVGRIIKLTKTSHT